MLPTDDANELLERVAALAHELTHARYAAVSVTDREDHVEGFFVSGLDGEALRRLKTPPLGHGPLGSLRREGKPVRIDNLDEQTASFGFPPKHPDMTALCGVPLWAKGEVRGSIYVTDKAGTVTFDDSDELILTIIAGHASRIIEERW